MRPITITLVLFYSLFSYGQQSELDTFVMVKATTLVHRSKASIYSKKIGLAKKGELVKIFNKDLNATNKDTINGITGTWVEVEYGGNLGYMFSGYLSDEIVKIPNSSWQGKYLILREGNYNEVIYSDKLNWYGIFPEKDGEYIKSVEVELDLFRNNEFWDDLRVKIKDKNKTRILIGTNEKIIEGRIGIPLGMFSGQKILSGQLLPIPIYENDCSINTNYVLKASNFDDQLSQCRVEKYYLRLCHQPSVDHIKYLFKFRDLLDNKGECNLPILFWFGDINNDNIPDFIFRSTKYSLYKSSMDEGSIYFDKVAEFKPGQSRH